MVAWMFRMAQNLLECSARVEKERRVVIAVPVRSSRVHMNHRKARSRILPSSMWKCMGIL